MGLNHVGRRADARALNYLGLLLLGLILSSEQGGAAEYMKLDCGAAAAMRGPVSSQGPGCGGCARELTCDLISKVCDTYRVEAPRSAMSSREIVAALTGASGDKIHCQGGVPRGFRRGQLSQGDAPAEGARLASDGGGQPTLADADPMEADRPTADAGKSFQVSDVSPGPGEVDAAGGVFGRF
jgi:hypothetical protein